MWDLWKAAIFGIPLASALVIPDTWSAGRTHEPGWTLPSAVPDHQPFGATFTVHCPSCQEDEGDGDEKDSFTFKFEAAASSQDCSPDSILVNDLALIPSHDVTGAASSGFFQVPSSRNSSGDVAIVSGLWTLNCSPSPESLVPKAPQPDSELPSLSEDPLARSFALSITSVNGKVVGGKSGFEVAFKQSPESAILHVIDIFSGVKTEPFQDDAHSDGPANLTASELDELQRSLIDRETKELRSLVAESERIQNAIEAKQQLITRYSEAEAPSTTGNLGRCHQLTCFQQNVLGRIKDILHRTGGAAKAFCNKLRPGSWLTDIRACRMNHTLKESSLGFKSPNSSWSPPGSSAKPGQGSSGESSEGDAPLKPSVHPQDQKSHDNVRFWIFSILDILIFVSILLLPVGLFILLRHRCSHTRRLERRWIRETRRTARAVRRAQRRHAWRMWWHNLWRTRETADYEEKRSHILSQEHILESAMQDEIRSLQSAAQMVTSLVSDEEARGAPGSTGLVGLDDVAQHRPLPRHGSIPDYRSESGESDPPPTYEDNDGTSQSGVVVDGFQYMRQHTPTPTELWTPSTSVLSPSESSQDGGSDDELSKD